MAVTYMKVDDGFYVRVDGQLFTHLRKGDGFVDDPNVKFRETVLVVSAADLIEIAIKADEVKQYGAEIPTCQSCKGTPNFPGEVCNPNEGMQQCCSPFHPFNIRNFGRP